MKLSIEIKPDRHGTILVIDYTSEFGEYIPEETELVLTRYYNFKYSLTCTIDILKAITVKEESLINTYFTPHSSPADSIRIPLRKDGFYAIHHIVLPTLEWLEAVKNEDLSEYLMIYVTDGSAIYKYFNKELFRVNPLELIEVNPYKTTISIEKYEIFNIDRLKACYVNISRQIMDNYIGKCSIIDDSLKFNRDFLWMTLNVIEYYLEWGQYSEAQIILEDLGCHKFCPDENPFKPKHKSCGCKK